MTGHKMVNGKVEHIELLVPTGNDSELLSNEDFGKWMRDRESNKQPQLLYLNSSCWSDHKATYEIAAARTPKLVNIPTVTSMEVFVDEPKNAMRSLVDSVRNGKSYPEIRKAMEVNQSFKDKNGNYVIFPDEDVYYKKVGEMIQMPIDISTKLYKLDENGQRLSYSIESDPH